MPSARTTASTPWRPNRRAIAGIELEGEHRLDVAVVDDAIIHAGDPAAGDGQPLAHLRVLLLHLGDARRGEAEGVAIVEGDAGRRGRADIGAGGGAAPPAPADSVGSNWARGRVGRGVRHLLGLRLAGGRWPDWLQAAVPARSKANSGSERRTGSLLLV